VFLLSATHGYDQGMNTKQSNKLAAAGLIMAAFAAPGWCTGKGDWTNVYALHRGNRIGVVHTDHKVLEGRFEGATGSTLVLEGHGFISVEKDRIVRVYKIGMSRKKRIVIGAAVGLAAGAVAAATISKRLNNEGFFAGPGGGAGAVAAIAGGGGIGIAIGSLSGNGQTTIYRKGR
jgi:hypothetical protein